MACVALHSACVTCSSSMVTPDLAEFLDTHVPSAFHWSELLSRVPDHDSQRAWARLVDHAIRLSSSHKSRRQLLLGDEDPEADLDVDDGRLEEGRREVRKRVCGVVGRCLVERAPSGWAMQGPFRLFDDLVNFFSQGANAQDSVTPLERILVKNCSVMSRALATSDLDRQAQREVGRSMVRVLTKNAKCVTLVTDFLSAEVRGRISSPSELVASLSASPLPDKNWACLLWREYADLVATSYLEFVFSSMIKRVGAHPEKFDLDDEENRDEFSAMAGLMIDLVATTVGTHFPRGLRVLLSRLQSELVRRFDGSDRVKYRALCSVMFGSLYSFYLHRKADEEADELVSAGLHNLAKVVNQVGSGAPPFETNMLFLNDLVFSSIRRLDAFVDCLLEFPEDDEAWGTSGAGQGVQLGPGDVEEDLRFLSRHFTTRLEDLRVLTNEQVRAQKKLAALLEMLSLETSREGAPQSSSCCKSRTQQRPSSGVKGDSRAPISETSRRRPASRTPSVQSLSEVDKL